MTSHMQNKFKALVIGDIIIDRYLIANEVRRSPEADIPLVYNYRYEDRAGGAANVAVNLLSLGVDPFLVGITGDDNNAHIPGEICTYLGIPSFIQSDLQRKTTLKTRVVDPDFRQLIRIDHEDSHPLSEKAAQKIRSIIREQINNANIDAVVMQDYNKGLYTADMIEFVQNLCREEHIPSFADPKNTHFGLLSGCDVFKPNIRELSLATGHTVAPDIESISAAISNLPESPGTWYFVTLAEKGIYYQNDEQRGIIPGIPIEDPDVSGAGDTVLAALVRAKLDGKDIENMAKAANEAGANVCLKRGVSAFKTEN